MLYGLVPIDYDPGKSDPPRVLFESEPIALDAAAGIFADRKTFMWKVQPYAVRFDADREAVVPDDPEQLAKRPTWSTTAARESYTGLVVVFGRLLPELATTAVVDPAEPPKPRRRRR